MVNRYVFFFRLVPSLNLLGNSENNFVLLIPFVKINRVLIVTLDKRQLNLIMKLEDRQFIKTILERDHKHNWKFMSPYINFSYFDLIPNGCTNSDRISILLICKLSF